tara:strand:+ start:6799 stop:7176 length:378 start_codon:yes stop_codon:yes gene_type:complete
MSSVCQNSGDFPSRNSCNSCNSCNQIHLPNGEHIPNKVDIQDKIKDYIETRNSILTSPELVVAIVDIYGNGEIEADFLDRIMIELLTEEGYGMMLLLTEVGDKTNVRFKYDVNIGEGIFYLPESN